MANLHRKSQCRQRQKHPNRRQQQQQQHQQQQPSQQNQQQCNNGADGKNIKSTTLLKIQEQQNNIIKNLSLTQQQHKRPLSQKQCNQEVRKLLPPELSFSRHQNTHDVDFDDDDKDDGSQSQRYKYTKAFEENSSAAATAAAAVGERKHRKQSKSFKNKSAENKTTATSTSTTATAIATTTQTKSKEQRFFSFEHIKWDFSSIWRLDSTLCIMLTMFVVATVVISGNVANASQRDSYKLKDTKTNIGGGGGINSVNAIPTGIFAIGTETGTGNNNNSNGSLASAIGGDTINIETGIASGNRNIGSERDAAASNSATVTSSTTHIMNHTTVTATETAFISTSSFSSSGTSTSKSSSSATLSSSSNGNAIASGNLQKAGSAGGANTLNGNIGINRNVIEIMEDVRSGPYFDKAASRNVTALLGKTAYLNCRVKNLGNKTMLLQVSWVRHRDIHLLTVGRYTYTSDQRFRAIHQPQTEDWILQIKYPQHRDSGIYECQVSTTPHMSHYIHLNVVEPSTDIIGAPDLYIESGSTINLTCVILNSPEPPAYIFWNHNNAIINYDSPRGGVSVVTNKGETTTSFLLIKSARPSDSGLYQCNPSNAKPKSVTVHVLNGEFPAAMQRAVPGHHRMSQSHYLLVYLSMYLFTLVYVGRFMELSPQPVRLQQQRISPINGINSQSENSIIITSKANSNTQVQISHCY